MQENNMFENRFGSAVATAPVPKAWHSCGTAIPAKSGQIRMAFSGHPQKAQQPLCYPRAAHKQQARTEAVTICVTLPLLLPFPVTPCNKPACHLPPAPRSLAGFDSILPTYAHAPVELLDKCPQNTQRYPAKACCLG